MGVSFHGYYEMLSSEDLSICGQSLYQIILFLWIVLCYTFGDVDLLYKEIDEKLMKPHYMKKIYIILHVCLNNFFNIVI